MEKATFAAGCFWGVQSAFDQINGVTSSQVGYAGGHTMNPTYEDVCSGSTGHAESIEIEFDPNIISYEQLVDVFWELHDPTQFHRQGPDVGSQYRSVIFYHDEEQRDIARDSRGNLDESGKYNLPIVTEIVPAKEFFRAEEYHQRYNRKKGGSCGI